MFKFVLFCAFVAAVSAHSIPSSYQNVVIHHSAPKVESWAPKVESWAPKVEEWKPKAESWAPKSWEQKEPEAPANYDFKYEVHDEHTGDIKRQNEKAVNGAVKGQYSLIDSDGFRRVVEYTADDHHGFQATVKREPTHIKIPQPAPKAESWAPKAESWAPKVESWAPKVEEWKPKAESWAPKSWEQKEPEAPANYDFKYEVHDEHTGDLKRQSETAHNGAVKGQYSLIDSDGYKRIVEYTADDHHGFQATVKREPTHYKVPQPAPKVESWAPKVEEWKPKADSWAPKVEEQKWW